MSTIKIFSSHRIDIDSMTVENPLIVPVRCGAVFGGNPAVQGDSTGENISEKRSSFCEFTVQYWAWKNEDADYYGLCHYRRFLSFADTQFKTNAQNFVPVPLLDRRSMGRFGLLDSRKMQRTIEQYDVVVSEPADVTCIPTPQGIQNTVYDHWAGHDGVFISAKDLPLLLTLVEELHPKYLPAAKAYLAGKYHRGYNCFVMKKELFFQMCQFQFDILFALEQRLDTTGYSDTMKRTPGFFGEILFGVFLFYLQQQVNVKMKTLQLVFFEETRALNTLAEYLQIGLPTYLRNYVGSGLDSLLPKGSQRRENLKKIYHRIKK